MIIHPFQSVVNGSGQAVVHVTHNLAGITWKVWQLGLSLGQVSLLAQAAAHVNGIPLTSTVLMQKSVFASLPPPISEPPYAMASFMAGPPHINLRAGDVIVVGIINAIAGDVFTVGAYVDEFQTALQLETTGP